MMLRRIIFSSDTLIGVRRCSFCPSFLLVPAAMLLHILALKEVKNLNEVLNSFWNRPSGCGCSERREQEENDFRDSDRCNCRREDTKIHRGCCSSGTDHGPNPYVTDIEEAAKRNCNFRTALWTGEHLQVTLMCLRPGEEIGAETHSCTDQFIWVVSGNGEVVFETCGCRNASEQRCPVSSGSGIFIPAGTRHNIINTGCCPLKLVSVYAPPAHARGTVEETKPCEAEPVMRHRCRYGRR